MANSHGLGWVPDIPSVRDYTADHPEVAPLLDQTRRLGARGAARGGAKRRGAARSAPAALPKNVDLRDWLSPIEDQGSLGSCTANAAVGLLEYFERRAHGAFIDASRLFLYKAERNLLGWTGDTGAYLRTAMEAMVLFGAPPERFWPYDPRPASTNTRYELEPPAFCYAFGANYQAIKYFRLDPNTASPAQVLANVKRFLAGGFPSMFGFPVYSEFDDPLPGGVVPFPSSTSHSRGGHAIVAVGYDDRIRVGSDEGGLLIRNSWGTEWGDNGYGWLSYRYVTEGLATDWWSLIKAKWVDTGKF